MQICTFYFVLCTLFLGPWRYSHSDKYQHHTDKSIYCELFIEKENAEYRGQQGDYELEQTQDTCFHMFKRVEPDGKTVCRRY